MKYKIVFKEMEKNDRILGFHFKVNDEKTAREAYAEFKKKVEAISAGGRRCFNVEGLYRIDRIDRRAILTKIC